MVSAQVCLCWMVHPSSRGLSPPVSTCFVTCMPGVGWCVRLPEVLSPPLSACFPLFPACVPVLDAASAFPKSCHPLSPTVFPHMCACVGWCVRLSPLVPLVSLVSLCCPHIVAHVSLCWKVCSPSRGLVSPLSPHIYIYIYLPLSPTVSQCVPVDGGLAFLRRACVGWCVHIPELLSRLVPQLVSHVSPHVCLWRMMRPPSKVLSRLVSL